MNTGNHSDQLSCYTNTLLNDLLNILPCSFHHCNADGGISWSQVSNS
jgi:hypothetical protein